MIQFMPANHSITTCYPLNKKIYHFKVFMMYLMKCISKEKETIWNCYFTILEKNTKMTVYIVGGAVGAFVLVIVMMGVFLYVFKIKAAKGHRVSNSPQPLYGPSMQGQCFLVVLSRSVDLQGAIHASVCPSFRFTYCISVNIYKTLFWQGFCFQFIHELKFLHNIRYFCNTL